MKSVMFIFGILILTLMICVPAFASVEGAAHGFDSIEPALAVMDWQQVNTNGFGDPQTGEVTALAVFNNYIYAGTFNPVDPGVLFDGAQIFRSQDGVNWTPVTQPGFGVAHDIASPAILDLTVFNGYIYAGTGRGDGVGQIWRSVNGSSWSPMVINGFNDPDNVDVSVLTEFNGKLYAGVKNQINGPKIYYSSSGGSNTWYPETVPASGGASASITALTVFNGALYAAVESEGPVQIWSKSSGPWTALVNNGFGVNSTMAGGMIEFLGSLYIGAGNASSGAQLWRTTNGINDWAQVSCPAFSDPNNLQVEMVFVYQNFLYISVKNTTTGMELWRTPDSATWEQVNLDGFGDVNNTGSNRGNAAAVFPCQFFVGTSNSVTGGELWQTGLLCQRGYLPLILK